MFLFYTDEKTGKKYEIDNSADVEQLFRKLQAFIYKNHGLLLQRNDFTSAVFLSEQYVQDNGNEIDNWLKMNCSSQSVVLNDHDKSQYCFFFTDITDAMAFKLKWLI